MWLTSIIWLPSFVLLISAINLPTSPNTPACDQQCQIDRILGHQLSRQASIVHTSAAIPRWSDFDAPNPGTVVNVATEHDVLMTVRLDSSFTHIN